MKRRLSGAWSLLAVLFTIFGAFALQASEDRDEPRYRIDVDAVLLDLRVAAPGGKPISDLSETEFEIFQNDELRPVVFFEEFSPDPSA